MNRNDVQAYSILSWQRGKSLLILFLNIETDIVTRCELIDLKLFLGVSVCPCFRHLKIHPHLVIKKYRCSTVFYLQGMLIYTHTEQLAYKCGNSRYFGICVACETQNMLSHELFLRTQNM